MTGSSPLSDVGVPGAPRRIVLNMESDSSDAGALSVFGRGVSAAVTEERSDGWCHSRTDAGQ